MNTPASEQCPLLFFSKQFTVTNLETTKILRSVVYCVWDSDLALGRVELLGGLQAGQELSGGLPAVVVL